MPAGLPGANAGDGDQPTYLLLSMAEIKIRVAAEKRVVRPV